MTSPSTTGRPDLRAAWLAARTRSTGASSSGSTCRCHRPRPAPCHRAAAWTGTAPRTPGGWARSRPTERRSRRPGRPLVARRPGAGPGAKPFAQPAVRRWPQSRSCDGRPPSRAPALSSSILRQQLDRDRLCGGAGLVAQHVHLPTTWIDEAVPYAVGLRRAAGVVARQHSPSNQSQQVMHPASLGASRSVSRCSAARW
jgi:hypothetical protein